MKHDEAWFADRRQELEHLVAERRPNPARLLANEILEEASKQPLSDVNLDHQCYAFAQLASIFRQFNDWEKLEIVARDYREIAQEKDRRAVMRGEEPHSEIIALNYLSLAMSRKQQWLELAPVAFDFYKLAMQQNDRNYRSLAVSMLSQLREHLPPEEQERIHTRQWETARDSGNYDDQNRALNGLSITLQELEKWEELAKVAETRYNLIVENCSHATPQDRKESIIKLSAARRSWVAALTKGGDDASVSLQLNLEGLANARKTGNITAQDIIYDSMMMDVRGDLRQMEKFSREYYEFAKANHSPEHPLLYSRGFAGNTLLSSIVHQKDSNRAGDFQEIYDEHTRFLREHENAPELNKLGTPPRWRVDRFADRATPLGGMIRGRQQG